MIRTIMAALLAILITACRSMAPTAEAPAPVADPTLPQIEARTGGRLGVALIDARGTLLAAHRANERFAMCSTFKLPLAGMVLQGAERGRWSMDDVLQVAAADIVSHSPVAQRHVASGRISLSEGSRAIVTVSDNGLANIILRRVGGPEAFTAWLAANGDRVTRLDRWETALNENVEGDPRDTTSPTAMADLTRRLLGGPLLQPAGREQLRAWMVETQTGLRRVRAGLPQGWAAGDKTGSCGTAYNDVAWFRTPAGQDFYLAVYLDRPTVTSAEAEAAIADVARAVVPLAR